MYLLKPLEDLMSRRWVGLDRKKRGLLGEIMSIEVKANTASKLGLISSWWKRKALRASDQK
ncbi:hypothetical protein GUJ93_ZPchr0004g40451 [Zizania palustris]|uniref:Uncharacterized protein n=1 Tax=Zizania palustris TaxID=103762 RepID=A0A8J5VZB2_ZIZPA|nr:hypothetical protein GUJ93_ZPchr0004g40451 [Zizania palustris]